MFQNARNHGAEVAVHARPMIPRRLPLLQDFALDFLQLEPWQTPHSGEGSGNDGLPTVAEVVHVGIWGLREGSVGDWRGSDEGGGTERRQPG